MSSELSFPDIIQNEERFLKAVYLFNSSEWYLAHDLFEELWHETSSPERITLQALLQIAVAEYHLTHGNLNGAMILYGEAIGRLSNNQNYDLGLDINKLLIQSKKKLTSLHMKEDYMTLQKPKIIKKISTSQKG